MPSGIPDFRIARAPACGRTSTRWRSPTSTPSGATRSRFWRFYGERFQTLERQAAERRPRGARRARARRPARRGDHAEHRSAPRPRRLAAADRGARHDRPLVVSRLPRSGTLAEVRARLAGDHAGDAAVRLRRAAQAGRRAVRRVSARDGADARRAARRRRRSDAVHRLLARGLSGRGAAGDDARRRRPDRDPDAGTRRPTTAGPRCG